ncbi:MAG: caspase family protein [Armatimonadetes bacterium]|nr:caspase family protein [Armatimonadota bacterium]
MGRLLAFAAMGAALVFSSPAPPPDKAQTGRLRLIPIVSDQRLEDIQESPDGTRLLTHDRGFAPRLWDPRTMRLLAVLPNRLQSVGQAVMSDSGTLIATNSRDEIRLWETATAHVVATFDAAKAGSPFIRVAISPDGKRVAIAGPSDGFWLAEAPDFELKPVSTGISSADALDLEFSADGNLLALSTKQDFVAVYDFKSRGTVRLKTSAEGNPWAEISADGSQVLVTCADNNAYLFEYPSGRKLGSFPHIIGEKGSVPNTLMAALFVGPGQSEFLVCGPTGTLTVYDRKTLEKKRELTGYTRPVREIRKSRDGLRVATYEDNEFADYDPLKLWDVESGKEFPFNRAGGPTAGAFSPDGSVFWVGYENGSIVQHRLADGEWKATTISTVRTLDSLRVVPQTGRVLVSPTDGPGNKFSFDARKVHLDQIYSTGAAKADISQNGAFAISPAYVKNEDESQSEYQACWNLATDKPAVVIFNDSYKGSSWGPDNKMLSFSDKRVDLFDPYVEEIPDNGKVDSYVKNFIELNEGFTIAWARMSDDFSTVIVGIKNNDGNDINDYVQLIDADSGEYYDTIATKDFVEPGAITFVKGQPLVFYSSANVHGIDVKAHKEIWTHTLDSDTVQKFCYSPDGSSLYRLSPTKVERIDPANGDAEAGLEIPGGGNEYFPTYYLDTDGKLAAIAQARQVSFIDLRGLKLVRTVTRPDQVSDLQFLTPQNRLIITDATEQATIWELDKVLDPAEPESLGPIGSFVLMHRTPDRPDLPDNAWLVMDSEGRFDAPDPNKVAGAAYVLEWSGGLEPIDVGQLKSLYYEPGLFGKLLGFDNEARRPVPDRETIRLFPEITVTPNKSNPSRLTVTLTDRDNGGIGQADIYLNGKLVATKSGSGFFTLDTTEYKPFFLPKSQLGEGKGNLLTIVAANARGDLKSPPTVIDLGIPEDLAVPPTNIYGLFVGVGNYVGTSRDLTAPPYDARVLGQAVKSVAERLLPGKVHITVMTTDDSANQPDRKPILDWFADVAQKATSSDIVVVFFAGHGTSSVAGKSGYFFLTAGADPSDISAAVLGVHTISGDDLQQALGQIPAGKQVIVLDTCHSGAAAGNLIQDRSSGSDYVRAYEAIRDATGTWLLAGAAADQMSYESRSVDHGLLTYALLEALDRVSPAGLRATNSGDMFVDVGKWLGYAADRVESLRAEVGIDGVQKPELKRSKNDASFDIGVTGERFRGEIGLKPPMPIVLMGTFDQDEEDPLGLEPLIADAIKDQPNYKLWLNVAKHPNAFRVAGQYTVAGDKVALRLFIQRFDGKLTRTNIKVVEIAGVKQDIPGLVQKIKETVAREVPSLAVQGG